MKKSIITLILAVFFVSVTFAQQNRQNANREKTAQDMVDRVERKIDLTEKQKADLLKYFDKMQAENKQSQLDARKEREKRMDEREALRSQRSRELEKILGKEKYDELMDSQNNRELSAKEYASRMAEKYNLTEKQRADLENYYRKNRADRETMREQERKNRDEFQQKQDRELEKILGKEKADEMRQQSQSRRGNRPVDAVERQQEMDKAFDKMADVLGMSDERREDFRDIFGTMQEKGMETMDSMREVLKEKEPQLREFMEQIQHKLENIFDSNENVTKENGDNTSYSIL
ncbi:MAG: hypothetical protein PHO94_04620 [Petrimonas sp.]|nr:hypothetical protein [Petrimonas sp.]